MTVLLTGATGLLGRAVLPRLAARGDVIAVHRPGVDPVECEGVRWIAADLTAALKSDLPARIDAVLHLAQSRRFREFPDGAVDVMEINAMATTRLLDYCHNAGGAVFVYASSGAVIGPGTEAITEHDIPHPTNLYAISKWTGEQVGAQFRSVMRVQSLRYFFIYGPGQRAMMMPGIIGRIADGQEVQLAGEDGIRTNPVYVDDAADATVRALDLGESATVNIAGPEVVTVRRISELAGRELGIKPRFATAPAQPDLVASIDRMGELLVAPAISPAEGLRRMVAAR